MARKKLGELLIEADAIDQMQLNSALGEQKKWGRPLGQILVELGFIKEDELVQALSAQLNFPAVNLQQLHATYEALQMLDFEFCVANSCFPFGYEERGQFLDVAMADPTNPALFDTIRVQTRCNIRPHIAGHHGIEMAIRRDYLGEAPAVAGVEVDKRPWYSKPDEMVFDPSKGGVAKKPPAKKPPAPSPGKTPPAPSPGQKPQAPSPGQKPQAKPTPPNAAPRTRKPVPPEPALEPEPAPPRRMRRPPTEERPPMAASARDQLLMQLHETVRQLIANQERDEKVLRKLMTLLVEKGFCTRAEIMSRIHED